MNTQRGEICCFQKEITHFSPGARPPPCFIYFSFEHLFSNWEMVGKASRCVMGGDNRPQTRGCLGNRAYIVVSPENCHPQSPAPLCKQQRSRSPHCREDEGPFHAVFPVFNESWDATGDRDGACGCAQGAGQASPARSPAWGQGPITGGKPNSRLCQKQELNLLR